MKKKRRKKKKNRFAWIKNMSSTKLFTIFIFANCQLIIIYAMVMMAVLRDLSTLTTLINTVVASVITYAVYCLKSTMENRKGGITYELAMKNGTANETLEQEDNEDSTLPEDEGEAE